VTCEHISLFFRKAIVDSFERQIEKYHS